jgi:hypothetical protein
MITLKPFSKLIVCSLAILLSASAVAKPMDKKEKNEIIGGSVAGGVVAGAGVAYGVLKKKANDLGISLVDYLKLKNKAAKAGSSVEEYVDDRADEVGVSRESYLKSLSNGLSEDDMKGNVDNWIMNQTGLPRKVITESRELGRSGKDLVAGANVSNKFYNKHPRGGSFEDRFNNLGKKVRNAAGDAEDSRTRSLTNKAMQSMRENGESQGAIDERVAQLSAEGQIRRDKIKPLDDKIEEGEDEDDESYLDLPDGEDGSAVGPSITGKGLFTDSESELSDADARSIMSRLGRARPSEEGVSEAQGASLERVATDDHPLAENAMQKIEAVEEEGDEAVVSAGTNLGNTVVSDSGDLDDFIP